MIWPPGFPGDTEDRYRGGVEFAGKAQEALAGGSGFLFWLFIAEGREPEKEGQPAGAALHALRECMLAEHTGPGLSWTLLVGGLHISHGDSFHSLKSIWLSDSWLVLSPQITSFTPMAGGSCITAHQTWLLGKYSARFHKKDLETRWKALSLPRKYLWGHLAMPMWMHCLPRTHWFLQPRSWLLFCVQLLRPGNWL